MPRGIRPTALCGDIAKIDPLALRIHLPGITAIAWDLDSTLTGHHDPFLPDAHVAKIVELHHAGYTQGFGSNAGSEHRSARVLEIADRLTGMLGETFHAQTSNLVGGSRKPLRPLYDKLATTMDVDKSKILFIGDQILKDIWGANRAGYGASMLVRPYGNDGDFAVKYLQRPLESLLRAGMGLPRKTAQFDAEPTLARRVRSPHGGYQGDFWSTKEQ